MLALCPDTLIGKRDRALLALGFAGAFRRSELCALEVADLAEMPDGLRVLIRRSKTDQEGQGQEVAIPRGYRLRPVEAVQTWLAAAENTAPLTGLPLPGLLAGRGGLESAMRAERPAGSRTAAECAPTRKEPAALRVRPSLGHWPVADSHARS